MDDSVKLLIKVRKTIEEYAMLQNNERVIVAVSGGCDSVALLRILYELSKELNLFLVVGHVNHGIREEAQDEEDFVRDLARSLKLPFEVERVDAVRIARERRLSLEMAGRELRYRYLRALALRYGVRKIALGHQRDDHVETVLLNLTRGSGIDGLRGIQPVRDEIIRPLIFCTREEIRRYLDAHGFPYMVDSSNRDKKFTRNRIRHELIPLMKRSLNPRIEEAIDRLSRIAASQEDFLRKCSQEALDRVRVEIEEPLVGVSTEGLAKLPTALQEGIIRLILERVSPEGTGIYWIHVSSVRKLALDERRDRVLNMPHGIKVEKCGERLLFIPPGGEAGKGECPPYEYAVNLPGEIFISEAHVRMHLRVLRRKISPEELKKDRRIAYMDLDTIEPPLKIRNRRPGDVFHPLGMEGRKKLKDFFIDEKIDRLQRSYIPLLVDMRGIIWVGGLRIDHRVRVSESTQNVLQAEII